MREKVSFLLPLFIFVMYSMANAGDPDTGYGTLIAVEIMNGSESTGYIGKLEYTGKSVDIVTFGQGVAGNIVTLPEVCRITEKKISSKGVHFIKCINQYGTVASGTINFRDQVNPTITLVRESGQTITNITAKGKSWQKINIPNIFLGQ